MSGFTIGQLAKHAGIGVETVRYYEREGLLHPPPRPRLGIRRYGEPELQRLRAIRRAQEFGFTLREIDELLALEHDPEASCSDVRDRARDKITAIEDRIRALQRMRRALAERIATCRGDGAATACPILASLLGEELP